MFKDMGEVFGDQTSLTLDLPSGVTLSYAFRLHPDTSPLPISPSLKLGNILRESQLVVLLEFTVEPLIRRAYHYELGKGIITLQTHSLEPTGLTIPLQLTRPINHLNLSEIPPHEIVQALSHISLYRMQEKVHTELFAGNIEGANRQLEMLATQLFSRGEKELAETALIEMERLRSTHALSIEGRKQIKYGTRSLAVPTIIKGVKHD
jgi:Ca-activated chloride channel family protein